MCCIYWCFPQTVTWKQDAKPLELVHCFVSQNLDKDEGCKTRMTANRALPRCGWTSLPAGCSSRWSWSQQCSGSAWRPAQVSTGETQTGNQQVTTGSETPYHMLWFKNRYIRGLISMTTCNLLQIQIKIGRLNIFRDANSTQTDQEHVS